MERPAKRTFVRDLSSLADRYNAKAVLLVKKKKRNVEDTEQKTRKT